MAYKISFLKHKRFFNFIKRDSKPGVKKNKIWFPRYKNSKGKIQAKSYVPFQQLPQVKNIFTDFNITIIRIIRV
jgi:hypothetical protein